ncbi:MAG: IS3 family transposase [Rhodospirillum sp.]|nr:IS3 family transposase [Rhodospirillum sp.]MCF8500943.1 IS3 family transposase [Rhodospirillum sp.]
MAAPRLREGKLFGPPEVDAMSARVSPSSGRAYGIARVTRIWGIGRALIYRHRAAPVPPRRRGPTGPLSDIDLVDEIRAVLTASPFHGEGYRKVWARLRFKGIRTAERRVMRLMREHGLQAPSRRGRPRGPRTHDGIIRTKRVDEMWGMNLTGKRGLRATASPP